jgi:hypothetical protein
VSPAARKARPIPPRKPSRRALKFRFRNRMLRGVVWVFVVVFVLSVVGVAVVTTTAHR